MLIFIIIFALLCEFCHPLGLWLWSRGPYQGVVWRASVRASHHALIREVTQWPAGVQPPGGHHSAASSPSEPRIRRRQKAESFQRQELTIIDFTHQLTFSPILCIGFPSVETVQDYPA